MIPLSTFTNLNGHHAARGRTLLKHQVDLPSCLFQSHRFSPSSKFLHLYRQGDGEGGQPLIQVDDRGQSPSISFIFTMITLLNLTQHRNL